MAANDQTIVEEVLHGDRHAFRTLVERHQDRLYDLAFRLTGHRQEAEDIVQTAFVRMYSRLSGCDPRLGFSNWAYTITLNAARDLLRRRAILRVFSLDRRAAPDEEEDPPPEPEDAGPTPEDRLLNEEMLAQLHRCVRELPLGLSAVFILRYFHHDDVEDIARKLGVSKNVVHVRLCRARERLQRELAERFPAAKSAVGDGGGPS